MQSIYSVYDKKAQSFNTPFFAFNDDIARRSFCDLIRDKRSFVSQHPEDFVLFRIGSFDESLGTVLSESSGPYSVVDGFQALREVLRFDKDFKTMVSQMVSDPQS